MRDLVDHRTNDMNDQLRVVALDEPGQGGAHHDYHVMFGRGDGPGEWAPGSWAQGIKFQNGPVKEAGVNGMTHEALLAIIIDRLRSFQRGPFSCRENALALTSSAAACPPPCWRGSMTIAGKGNLRS